MIKQVVDFILDLGPTIMLPIIMTLFGMILRQGFKNPSEPVLRSELVLSVSTLLLIYL
ncbi:hypothetical protein ACEQPO_10060 [Bacillus sp. SL00103]